MAAVDQGGAARHGTPDRGIAAGPQADCRPHPSQERKIAKELDLRLDADLSYMDEGIALMSIAKDAKNRFLEADLVVKKHLLSVVLSNCSFQDRKIMTTFRKPFDIIAEKLPDEGALARINGAKIPQNSKWLPELDSNQRPSD